MLSRFIVMIMKLAVFKMNHKNFSYLVNQTVLHQCSYLEPPCIFWIFISQRKFMSLCLFFIFWISKVGVEGCRSWKRGWPMMIFNTGRFLYLCILHGFSYSVKYTIQVNRHETIYLTSWWCGIIACLLDIYTRHILPQLNLTQKL